MPIFDGSGAGSVDGTMDGLIDGSIDASIEGSIVVLVGFWGNFFVMVC